MRIRWIIILRNTAIVIGLTFVGSFVVTLSDILFWKVFPSRTPSYVSELTCKTLGFFISGCLTPYKRWKYLSLTVLSVWLLDLTRLTFAFGLLAQIWGSESGTAFAIMNRILALPVTFILMLVGGGLSALLVRGNSSTF